MGTVRIFRRIQNQLLHAVGSRIIQKSSVKLSAQVAGGAPVGLIDKEFFQNSGSIAKLHQADAARCFSVILCHPEVTAAVHILFRNTAQLRLIVYRHRRASSIVLAVQDKAYHLFPVFIGIGSDFYHNILPP